jgi:hypothetical protein
VGRLLWLKAFDKATVRSVFGVKGSRKSRAFNFDAQRGVSDPVANDDADAPRQTVVTLSGFARRYREASPKTAPIIARQLFEHCLWYFVRPGGAPAIEILDGDTRVSLDRVYEEHMVSKAHSESLELKGATFELLHIKLSASSSRTHSIAFCAANRLVTQESIKGKIPGLFGSLHENGTEFHYECYVSSPLLDERVRSERTGFDIEEVPLELFASQELTQKEIRDAVLQKASFYLADYLEEKKRLSKERVWSFVGNNAPRYRPILNRIPDDQLAVDPNISDKDLDLVLHTQLAEIERQLLADGHDVMEPKDNEDYEDYQARLQTYLKTAGDIKKSDLANYVAHRRIILDVLEKAIQRQNDGKYVRRTSSTT